MYMAGYSTYAILAGLGGPERATIAGNVDAFVVGFEAGSIEPNIGASVTGGARRRGLPRISPHR
jgi:hypothetical protein